jgi:streptomycin 3"-adenylyltransferase
VTARDQLRRIARLVRQVLGADALGAYPFGSVVRGGLKPRSDLDVLVVARRPTTTAERRTLIARLLPISGRGMPSGKSRSVELTIVAQADMRPWRYPPRLDFLYGDWLRAQFEAGNLTPWESPNPDLALAITQVLQANHPLFGPPPAEILDPVPRADVRRAMIDGIPGLLVNLETDTANVLLTFARIWVTLVSDEIVPKDAAADWVLARIPDAHRTVLGRARGVYLGTAENRWDDAAAVRAHVDHVLGEIERAAGA